MIQRRRETLLGVTVASAVCLWIIGVRGGAVAAAEPTVRQAKGVGAVSEKKVALPETAAGRQMAAWLTALNSGEPEKMRAFRAAAGPKERAEELADRDLRFYESTGGLDLRGVEDSAEHRITGLFYGRLYENYLTLTVEVAPEPPHALQQIMVRPARQSVSVTGTPPRRLSEAEIAKNLEAYLDRLAKRDAFSGTALITKDGKQVFARAYGMAHRGYGIPNRLDTKFNLGSMNKMFTAVAIAQLAEQGKLAFEDTVGKHLPDYPNKEVATKVTIHHLLTHTSGLTDYFTPQYMESSKDRYKTVESHFPLFVNAPLAFTPGERFRYSNAGFIVLGAIIEKVSGGSYFDYVREHIYKPAGMVNTDAYEMDTDVPNLAFGYTRGERDPKTGKRAYRNNLFLHVVKGGPAGGGFSTVEDLTRFAEALRSGKLLSAKYRDLVLTGKVEGFGPGAKYAYGFEDSTENGVRIVGHGGGFPGINAQLDIYLNRPYTVAVMSNYDPPAAQAVADRIREMLTTMP